MLSHPPEKTFRLLPKSCKPQERAVYLKNASKRLPARPNPANEPSDDITTPENKARLLVIQRRRNTCSCDVTSAASRLDKSSAGAPSRGDGQILHFTPVKSAASLVVQHVDAACTHHSLHFITITPDDCVSVFNPSSLFQALCPDECNN